MRTLIDALRRAGLSQEDEKWVCEPLNALKTVRAIERIRAEDERVQKVVDGAAYVQGREDARLVLSGFQEQGTVLRHQLPDLDVSHASALAWRYAKNGQLALPTGRSALVAVPKMAAFVSRFGDVPSKDVYQRALMYLAMTLEHALPFSASDVGSRLGDFRTDSQTSAAYTRLEGDPGEVMVFAATLGKFGRDFDTETWGALHKQAGTFSPCVYVIGWMILLHHAQWLVPDSVFDIDCTANPLAKNTYLRWSWDGRLLTLHPFDDHGRLDNCGNWVCARLPE